MRRIIIVVLATMVIAGILLSACGSPPTPEAAKPAEAPKAEKPTDAPKVEKPTDAPKSTEGGQLQIAGSTTVQPLAEKLAGEYTKLNSGVTIDIQGGGTSV